MKYIKGFNGLRAFSILLVLLTHLGTWDHVGNDSLLSKAGLLFSASSGVYIFFAISGYLITQILLREKKEKGTIHLKRFYLRRFLRLSPPILIFFLVLLFLMFGGYIERSFTAVIISFFYLYNFVTKKYQTPELGHTWSLGVEEQFYLFWPLVIRSFPDKKVIVFSCSLLVICLVAPFIYSLVQINFHQHIYSLDQLFTNTNRFLIPAISPIMIGSIFSVWRFQGKFNGNSLLWVIGFLVLFSLQLILPAGFFAIIPDSFTKACASSMLLVYLHNNQDSGLTNFLEFAPLNYLGKISYGVYIWQGLFLRNGPGGQLSVQHFPLNVFCTLVVAILSYEILEKRIQRYKTKFSD